ncbi:sulfatase-like hydrolase/transferase [Maribellus comscasis]|uniref:Sulfatase-like hydrolase/transferase n=1 Tax=Maribellus comscasis TaxID=2681766 RepID=A0A6I6K063_9BACT|nr:arylsulfatase [Maribellus comscasis]QGY46969.1 sulfatase-like hydrolase/transferase [Maribellus comscasis]
MKYVNFLLLIIFITGCTQLDNTVAEKSVHPNIIYILADDLGYGDVSCLNENSKLCTPAIDKLANEGVLFTDAHTSSAVCTPTRYGILTGRYNWRSTLKRSVLSGYSKALIAADRLTVEELLQKNNYHTAFIGKWHLGWDWNIIKSEDWQSGPLGSGKDPEVDFGKAIKNGPNERGFSYSYGFSGSLDMPPYVYVENGMPTSIPTDTTVCVDDKGFWRKGLTGSDFKHAEVLPHLTDKSVQYINERAQANQPFFLYFALPAPHTPILPSSEFLGKSNTNFYGDFVLQVDDVVRRITEAVNKSGISNNTVIMFTSDNGCSPKANFAELKNVGHNPSYVFRGHKADIYEGGHRVPFIVKWPQKVKPGRKSDEIICTTDLMATVADIVDFTLPENAAEDSYSFLPVLTGENYKSPIREAIVNHSIDGRFAIRKGDWKLVLWPGSGGWSFPRTEKELNGLPDYQLFNLKEDPSEKTNLVNEYPDKVNELRALLTAYIVRGRSTSGSPQENDKVDNWPQIDWISNEH